MIAVKQRMMNSCFGALLVLFATQGLGAQISESDVRVSTAIAPADAPLTHAVRVVDREDHSRLIEIALTNRSAREISLLSAEVEFPWSPTTTAGLKIAAGATATGRWPPTLVRDATNGRSAPESGMYLLAQREGGYALAGFVSWQTFWSKLRYGAGTLTMKADGEGRLIRPGETVALEKIRLAEGPNWQDLLFDYADAIARELRLRPKPARNFVGWSTWDYYGRAWNPAEVTGNLDALQHLVPNANLIQIDGGWWRQRGDFVPRADLGPDGMTRIATEIRAHRLIAGIHLDGMRAALKSTVAQAHPEYFLHDDRGALLVEKNGAGGDGPYVFFDYSQPGACDYMRDALRRLRREWGYDYFKIDYLRAGIAEDLRQHALGNAPDRTIVPFNRGLTSVERFHRAMAAFRAGMGDDAYFLGCSTPFGPTFGHVDAVRTGPDISPKFASYQSQCEANAGNFYLNGRVVQVDADYVVVRGREDQDATLAKDPSKDGGDLSLNEAGMWADYVALFGGPKLASDDLMILRDERKALVKFATAQPACTQFVPLDYWDHARTRTDAFQAFLGEAGHDVFLALFNWSNTRRTYVLRAESPNDLRNAKLVRGAADLVTGESGLSITLAAREAAVFRLPADTNFDRARKNISVAQSPAGK